MDRDGVKELRIPIECGWIHVRSWGPPDPVETVILLHGGPGVAEQYMEPIVRFVDNGLRRIGSYDQRGTGRSRCDSEDPGDFGLDAQAADLTLVIDSLAAGPVHLLGHSWGGIVAMDYAARHGDRLASIIAVGSAPPNHGDLAVAQAAMSARVEALQERGLIPLEEPESATEGLRAVVPMYLWDPTLALPDEAVQSLEVTPGVGGKTWAALEGFDLTEPLRAYRGPALVIFGEADPIGLPAAEATRVALANSQLRYEILERCGHFPWFEAPARFQALLDEFLSSPSEP